jgi:hypothetical protein
MQKNEKYGNLFKNYIEMKEIYKSAKIKKCVNPNCKATSTIFKFEDDTHIVLCGNTDNPCSLNIKLKKGKYIELSELIIKLRNELNVIKDEIVDIKMTHMYNKFDENVLINVFDKIKIKYIKKLKELTKYDNINNNNIDVVNDYNIEIENKVATFKKYLNEYKGDPSKNRKVLKTLAKYYKDTIINQNNVMFSKNKFEIQNNEDTGELRLIKGDSYDEVELKKPKIIKFIIS